MARSAREPDAYKVVVRVPVSDDLQDDVVRALRSSPVMAIRWEWEIRKAGSYGVRAIGYLPLAFAEEQGSIATLLHAVQTVELALRHSIDYVFYGDAGATGTTWLRWPED